MGLPPLDNPFLMHCPIPVPEMACFVMIPFSHHFPTCVAEGQAAVMPQPCQLVPVELSDWARESQHVVALSPDENTPETLAEASPVLEHDHVLLPVPPRAPVLQSTFSAASNIHRVWWTVDARKLKSADTAGVSPPFDLLLGRPVTFRLMIRPKTISTARGGASFKKAKGKGTVELRCLDEVSEGANPVVHFRIGVGNGYSVAQPDTLRGPVQHDFAMKSICGLPAGQDEWDFSKAVDEVTQTFVVCLEIFAGAGNLGHSVQDP